jgi:hypothetical protein
LDDHVADLRAFDDVPRPEPPAPESVIAALRDRAAEAAAARRALTTVVGEAESEDGLVRAVVGAAGLVELILDPKAMRMASSDLARQIVEVTAAAREDLDARRKRRAAELGVPETGVELADSLAQLTELQSTVAAGNVDLQAMFERMRARFGV